ncbi:MAG: LytTR family DNA-binding domain-containing protein [Pseudomonadota bacterium]
MHKKDELLGVLVAFVTAGLLAAHRCGHSSAFSVIGGYAYWTFRILVEAGLFAATLFAVERYIGHQISKWSGYAAAILFSLIPFTLAVTALDLVLGLPELGIDSGRSAVGLRLSAFVHELFYLLDNHVFLCILILIPRLMRQFASADNLNTVHESMAKKTETTASFIESINPPLKGHLCSIEAQEHYIKVTTTEESRMILYRFSDAIRQLPVDLGMQVHRSHWVAHAVVEGIESEGQQMRVVIGKGGKIPVSRTYRAAVEERYPVHISNAESSQSI